jgi:hypothetical protein
MYRAPLRLIHRIGDCGFMNYMQAVKHRWSREHGLSCRISATLWLLGVLIGLSSGLSLLWAAEVTVASLLAAPDRYDQQEVTLTGTAQAVKPTTSRRGNPYTTFQLSDPSGKAVTIFSWGHPDLKTGDRVEVTGIFQRVKRVGQYTFYNEIEAKAVHVIGR